MFSPLRRHLLAVIASYALGPHALIGPGVCPPIGGWLLPDCHFDQGTVGKEAFGACGTRVRTEEKDELDRAQMRAVAKAEEVIDLERMT